MELLNATNKVFRFYREKVKGNENITLDQLQRKLSRNRDLAMKVPPRNDIEKSKGNQLYFYGNLHFVVRNGTIIHIRNHTDGKNHYGGWHLDIEKYNKLTKYYGIID